MKKSLFVLALMFSIGSVSFAQASLNAGEQPEPTSIGMVIYSQDVETVWNAFTLLTGECITYSA